MPASFRDLQIERIRMELKEYQKKALGLVKKYLEILAELKAKDELARTLDTDLGIDFPYKAWEKISNSYYFSKKNGLGEPLPNFYLKIPTGGGKTILACHTIDLINRIYLRRNTGIVLWTVPTTQIYRQTIASLKNREHPYRQVLDIASSGRTVILEKSDRFSIQDIEQNLVIMMLMLPSANRLNKDVLKVFKDSGGFTEFFPYEDDRKSNEELLARFPNLDCYGGPGDAFGTIIKTSLGNTLKILRPVVIIDEGHKTYSKTAQDTIRNFNPSIIVELSATPPKNGNILVDISGQELNREEMIKLDLHITNKASLNWKNTLLAAIEKRNLLCEKTKEYESNTGEYIRPICLIQAERTGKDQRGSRFIHAEDVREHLINHCGIPNDEIAIKSSEKDDIEGIDLLSRNCNINYIITKQALQEGWDCSFAYILTILTNPSSQLSITQLVGRILRQPRARKTKIKELDESYVYCFRSKAGDLLANIRQGFQQEGLGDLYSRISIDEGKPGEIESTQMNKIEYRRKFSHFEGKIYLPKFVIQESAGWREVNYEMDILSRIDWQKANIESLKGIKLSEIKAKDVRATVGLSENKSELIRLKEVTESEGGLEINRVFITRQIFDIVPNPWIAFEIGEKAFEYFIKKYDVQTIANNLVFIIEELRKTLEYEKDRLAEEVFRDLIETEKILFFLVLRKGGYQLPNYIKIRKGSKILLRDDNTALEKTLFDKVPEDDFNEFEKAIAIYLDEQEKLLWWFRNISRQDYYIQAWKKHKIYPDFVFTEIDPKRNDKYSKIRVIETKGTHLKNEDTQYKKDVFKYCNELGQRRAWHELQLEFGKGKIEFQVIFEEDWKREINKIFGIDLSNLDR